MKDWIGSPLILRSWRTALRPRHAADGPSGGRRRSRWPGPTGVMAEYPEAGSGRCRQALNSPPTIQVLTVKRRLIKLLLDLGNRSRRCPTSIHAVEGTRSTVAVLTGAGWDAVRVHDVGLNRATDAQMLARAERRSYLRDAGCRFHALLAVANSVSPSVIRIRREGLRGERSPSCCWPSPRKSSGRSAKAMVTVTESSVRVRRLPILTKPPHNNKGSTVMSCHTYLPRPNGRRRNDVMLTWPHEKSDWAPILDRVEPVFTDIARQVARFEKV